MIIMAATRMVSVACSHHSNTDATHCVFTVEQFLFECSVQYVVVLSFLANCAYDCLPPETEHTKRDVDTSKLSTDEEIQSTCCIQTCAFGMAQKKLTCDNSENIRCGHTPYPWESFDQPEADIKWACCSAGPDRPEFKGCRALVGDSTCPGEQRIREDWENPFGDTRDWTKMAKAEQMKYCCKTSCYDQIKTRGLTCPTTTQMFHKHDFHNPFEWYENMKDKSDVEIRSKCCRPLNKCHIKLNQMGLSCDGIGVMPGWHEHEKKITPIHQHAYIQTNATHCACTHRRHG